LVALPRSGADAELAQPAEDERRLSRRAWRPSPPVPITTAVVGVVIVLPSGTNGECCSARPGIVVNRSDGRTPAVGAPVFRRRPVAAGEGRIGRDRAALMSVRRFARPRQRDSVLLRETNPRRRLTSPQIVLRRAGLPSVRRTFLPSRDPPLCRFVESSSALQRVSSGSGLTDERPPTADGENSTFRGRIGPALRLPGGW